MVGVLIVHPTPLRPLYRGEGVGVEFPIFFLKKGGELRFSHKEGGVGRIGEGCFKKGGITYFHTN